MSLDDITRGQRAHWKVAVEKHAGTPQAVGSESMEHKHLRYSKIVEVFGDDTGFTIHDVGPGIGDFYAYLQNHCADREIAYSASEITPEYCEIARSRYPDVTFDCRDVLTDPVAETYDYVVLSGVFHQRGDATRADWQAYMHALLARSFGLARKGIAFNILSPHADFQNPDNYYPDLAELQSFVTANLSRFFRMDHTYPLFEATFCVYLADQVRARYTQPEFQKYLGAG